MHLCRCLGKSLKEAGMLPSLEVLFKILSSIPDRDTPKENELRVSLQRRQMREEYEASLFISLKFGVSGLP